MNENNPYFFLTVILRINLVTRATHNGLWCYEDNEFSVTIRNIPGMEGRKTGDKYNCFLHTLISLKELQLEQNSHTATFFIPYTHFAPLEKYLPLKKFYPN
jgi:hypothetical protein